MRVAQKEERAVPFINITPLIDVLLVLLIIFMVVTPLRPARFKAFVPQPPLKTGNVEPHPLTLVVSIDREMNLKLNAMEDMGSVNDLSKLNRELARIFQERRANGVDTYGMADRSDLTADERVEKTVFIKAPREIAYGAVARVIDGIKGAGAEPVGLQIDDLD